MVTVLFSIYFFVLLLFCFISKPIYYCWLLIINSLICRCVCYLIFGFCWYSLLFCLIYVGGVYVLFIFISVYIPNRIYKRLFKFKVWIFLSFLLIIIGYFFIYNLLDTEFSMFLCRSKEGYFYLIMCLRLLFGFFMLKMIMKIKLNHYR